MYQTNTKANENDWVSSPELPDPDNLFEPAGWTLIVRPYPTKSTSAGGIILTSETIDFANYRTNIGRVVAVGKSCWNRPEHRDAEGNRYDWCKVGDFIEWGSHIGKKRKFKGISYIIINDDEMISRLPDPVVYEEGDAKILMDIPKADLEKYNTIYNPNYKKETY